MRILLDTNVFLWLISDDKRLSQQAKNVFLDDTNALILSMASIWEMVIKIGSGKLVVANSHPIEFLHDQLQENAIMLLPITFEHTAGLLKLPALHKDPFDRLIIAQAFHEKLPVLSSDAIFQDYGVVNLFGSTV